MNNVVPPIWVLVTYYAWAACGIYFIVAAFRTQRIREKEAAARRRLDSLLLWGSYVFMFLMLAPESAWELRMLPDHWLAPAGKAGAVVAITGLAYTVWARATLGQYWSRIVALKEDHRLVQSGPYRQVRHPLYSGLMLAALGTVLALGVWRALIGAALLWIGFAGRARREDTLLAGQFGAEFDAYRARTGRLAPRWSGRPAS
ncbi:MAG: methyltransferase family protein [Terriglobales bacterium]